MVSSGWKARGFFETGALTKLPDPWREVTSPSARNRSSAARITGRETWCCSARAFSPGRRSSLSSMRESKSQPISMMRRRAFSIALRPASK